MDIVEPVEVITDNEGHTLFMSVAGMGRTRALLKALCEQVGDSEQIWAVDPNGDIAGVMTLNPDGLPETFLKSLQVVKKVRDLPVEFTGVLAIDDGLGYFSLVENEEYFKKVPQVVFCTVEVKPSITL